MSQTKFLRCSCAQCGGHIEYPADAAGTTIDCPHCRQQTDLTVEVPTAPEPDAPWRGWLAWTLVILVILGAAGAAAPWLLKRYVQRNRNHPPAAAPAPTRSR